MTAWLERGVWGLVSVWALWITLVQLVPLWADPSPHDVGAFFHSAARWWQGAGFYDPTIPNVNLNPPHVTALLFGALPLVPLRQAAIVWTLVNLWAVAAALVLIRLELALSARAMRWLVAGVFASSASQHQWHEGQIGGVLMLVGTLAWRAERRTEAPAWLASLVSLKPTYAAMIPLICSWRGVLQATVLGAAGIGFGVWLFGVDAWRQWFTLLGERSVRPNPVNLSLLATIARLSGQLAVSDVPIWPHAHPVWAALAAGVLGVTWWTRHGTVDRRWLMAGLAAILVSPIGWAYYLLPLTGPFAAWTRTTRARLAVAIIIAVLCLPRRVLFAWAFSSDWIVLGSALSWASVALWLLAVRDWTSVSQTKVGALSRSEVPPASSAAT